MVPPSPSARHDPDFRREDAVADRFARCYRDHMNRRSFLAAIPLLPIATVASGGSSPFAVAKAQAGELWSDAHRVMPAAGDKFFDAVPKLTRFAVAYPSDPAFNIEIEIPPEPVYFAA